MTWFPFRTAGMPVSRRAAAVVASAALVALAVWRWTAGPPPGPPAVPGAVSPAVPSGTPASPSPLLEVQGSRLVGSDEAGRRLWDLEADSLRVDRQRRTVDVIGPRGRWYAGRTVAAVFEAPRGRYLADGGVIELEGGVTATSADGRTVRARQIRWDIRRGGVEARGDVVLRQPGAVLRADTLRGDAALTTVILEGRVMVDIGR